MWDQNTLVHKLHFDDLERTYRNQVSRQKTSGNLGGFAKLAVTATVFLAAVFVISTNFA